MNITKEDALVVYWGVSNIWISGMDGAHTMLCLIYKNRKKLQKSLASNQTLLAVDKIECTIVKFIYKAAKSKEYSKYLFVDHFNPISNI